MKIIDSFTFFNELHLLDIRLSILDDVVDYFVISEANISFRGQPKPFNFEDNFQQFSKYKDKIIYLKCKPETKDLDFTKKDKYYNPSSPAWRVENSQRDSIANELKNFSDEDIFFQSDLDEIWNPSLAREMRFLPTLPELCRLQMKHCNFYFNCVGTGKKNSTWHQAYFGKVNVLKKVDNLSYIRTNYKIPIIKDGGWHFSYLGNVNQLAHKISSSSHSEYDTPYFKNKKKLKNCIEKGIDIFDRDDFEWTFQSISNFPKKLQQEFKKYPEFIRDI